MRENHYAISCIGLKISYVFKSQDKHNASYFSEMSWQTVACHRKINQNIRNDAFMR